MKSSGEPAPPEAITGMFTIPVIFSISEVPILS